MDGMLGFTGGVMVAASIWSLLIPAIEMSAATLQAEANSGGFLDSLGSFGKVFPAVIGFLCGAGFLFLVDKLLPHLHINFKIYLTIFFNRVSGCKFAVIRNASYQIKF